MDRQYRICCIFLSTFLFCLTTFSASSATLVGNTSGIFTVSSGGNATYRLSLSLPPGTAGMQPELALAYSSGAGDGIAGWGWNVSGLSSIRRCRATYAQNGRAGSVTFDSGDRLCLDGNQLMLVSGIYLAAGAVYRPELDDFTKVTQVGSGTTAYFKAERKDGRILFFGSATDSRILRDGGTAVHTWALSKIMDRSVNRNYISISYSLDSGGQYLPESVKYTGSDVNTPYYDVDFVYETRPSGEARTVYSAGSDAGYTQRLDRVDVKYGTTVVRRYQLTYETGLSPVTERSRLASVQECGMGAVDCYKPVVFDWQDADSTRSSMGWRSRARWFDIDGDGSDDAVYHGGMVSDPNPDPYDIYDDGFTYTKMAYALSSGSGTIATGIDTNISWTDTSARTAQPLDFNGDGKMDVAFNQGGNVAVAVWNNGYSNANVVVTDVTFSGGLTALDINGDGYDDLAKADSGLTIYLNKYPLRPTGFLASDYALFSGDEINPQASASTTETSAMQDDGFTAMMQPLDPYDPYDPNDPVPGVPPNYPTVSNVGIGESSDFDGDGRQDLLLPVTTGTTREWFAAFSRISGVEAAGTEMHFAKIGSIREPQLGDVNGDGLTDIVYLTGSTDTVYIRLGKGISSSSANTSFSAPISTGLSVAPHTVRDSKEYFQLALADVNLDGMQDLLFVISIDDGTSVTKYRWRKALSTGAGFAAPVDSGLAGDTGTYAFPPQLAVMDQNGDGAIDLLMQNILNKAGGSFTGYAGTNDQLTSITDSYGKATTVDYAPLITLHDWSGQGSVADAFRYMPRRDVVASYTSDDGDGGTFTVDYSYSGGMLDRRGRGFLGFTSRIADDSRLPLSTKTKYRQDFPYTGMISFVETLDVSTHNRVTFKQNGLTRQCFMPGIEAAVSCTGSSFVEAQEKRYHRYAGNVVEHTYAVNPASGALLRSVRTDRWTLDAYGNPRYVRISHSGADQLDAYDPQSIRTTTDTTYQNDTTGGLWCLGMPTQQTTSATTNGVTKYRTDIAAYSNCHLQSKTTGDGTTKPVTTAYTYDGFGNVETETLSATGETARVTTHEWSTDGRFLDAMTNALGHRATFTSYPDTSLPHTQTDPNGLAVEWIYDALGNRTVEKRADGTETVWSRVYCSTNCGVTNGEYQLTETQQRTGVSGSHFGRTQTIVDALDRVAEVRQPKLNATATVWGSGWSAVRTEYDALGRIHRQSMPFNYGGAVYWNVRSYDVLSRLTHEDLSNGGDRDYAYSGLVTTVTDPLNHQTEKETDAKGRVIRVTDALNGTTTYHYDGFDNLTDTYAPGNSHIHIDYDDRGFKIAMDDPDMGSWDYDYNAFGELVSQVDAKGQTTALTYDALGRLKTRTEAEGVTTWTYDGPGGTSAVPMVGKLYGVSQVEGGIEKYAETYLYDLLGRPVNVTTTIDGVSYDTSYEYDAYGRLSSVEYPESIETFINEAPVASAYTPSVKVLPGSVTLDGSATTDDNFPAPLTYQWSQTTGPAVALSGAAASVATFTPTIPGAYGFTLGVTDTELTDQASVTLQVRSPAPGTPSVPATSTSTSYTATWTAPSAGVTASTTYQLQEATNSSFTSGLRTITASTTSTSITGRTNTVTYYYRVRACEGSVCSSWSSTASAEVRLVPGTPGTLSATPASTDTGSISVTWGPASGNVTKYVLEEANGAFSNGVTRSWNVTSGTSLAITRTTTGTWLYRVRAFNDTVAGSFGNTDSVSVTLPATLATPTFSGVDHFNGNFTVSWNSGGSGVQHYDLERQLNSNAWTVSHPAASVTSRSESDVGDGTYRFRVRTCKATGCGAWSAIASVTINRPPTYKCPPFCDPFMNGESGTEGATEAPVESSTSADTASIDLKQFSELGSALADIERAGSDHAIGANTAPGVISGTPGMQSSLSIPLYVNAKDNNSDFRAMHPARPYDLARTAGARTARETEATPRAIKTANAGLVATAAVTTTGYRFKVTYEYDTWSHLKRVRNAEPNGTVYLEATQADAAGHVELELFGNGVMTSYVYNPSSGLLEEISSSSAAVPVQALAYDWDLAGNLTERRDERASLTEHVYYDALNRLDYSTLVAPGVSGTNLDLSYDAAGNISTKSGVGTYTYGGTRPHALTSLAKTGGGTDTFTYDANGNMATGAGRTLHWTSYNYPRRIEKGTTAVNFAYGPNRQRYKEERYSGGTLQARTLTVGSHFEKVEEPATGTTTYKHYIHAAGHVVAVHDRKSDFHHTTNYLHRDHLGSVDTITDKNGDVVARSSFDAFGQRRSGLNWNAGIPGSTELDDIREITTRGYTDHQMLDSIGLVHMNGRVYDPNLGRFVSADPFIAEPLSTQAFNRYAYVENNPLAFVDPSGFVKQIRVCSSGPGGVMICQLVTVADDYYCPPSEYRDMLNEWAETQRQNYLRGAGAGTGGGIGRNGLIQGEGGSGYANPTGNGIRNDPAGAGNFDSPRGGRLHYGADYLASPGQDIRSPISGEVTRHIKQVYDQASITENPGLASMRGIEVVNEALGVKVKIFYAEADNDVVRTNVTAGQVIGVAQDRAALTPGMLNHVHVYLYHRVDGTWKKVDPQLFLPSR